MISMHQQYLKIMRLYGIYKTEQVLDNKKREII